ncbi:MAG: recombinase family protein [Thermoplasmatota archaeon]
MKERVGLICVRTSEDKGQTVEGQEQELRRLAARMGVVVPEEFVIRAEAEGAFKGEPPSKARVLELARARKFDVLFVWSMDRWARRRIAGAEEVFRIFPHLGISFLSMQEP